MSRPARGAWVEIPFPLQDRGCELRRAPQGARGLKRSRILIAVSLHKKEVSANRQRLPFSILLIKTWVYVVDVFLVQAVLGEAQAFTEAYKMEITSL